MAYMMVWWFSKLENPDGECGAAWLSAMCQAMTDERGSGGKALGQLRRYTCVDKT